MKLINQLAIVIMISGIFLFPIEIISITGLYIFSLIMLSDFYFKKINPINIVLWLTFFIINILIFLFAFYAVSAYTGIIIYAAFFITFFIFALMKKNGVLFFRGTLEKNLTYQRILSILWLIIFFSAFFISILLMPNTLFIIIPVVLMGIGFIINFSAFLKIRSKQ